MARETTKSPTKKKTPATMSQEKSKKPRKPKTTTHPPYFQMIKEALMALKEKNGSSLYAISKQIEEKYKSVLPENFRKTLSLQLKNSVAKGKLVKIRASYKLLETNKMTTRSSSSSSRRSKKTVSMNKQEMGTKKKRSAKKKPRQPKSIKSSAGKKALKASAS